MNLKLKRIFDLFFCVVIGFFALPIIIVSMAIIHFCSPDGPAIFKQERIGYQGKKFVLYKIRSMTNERNLDGCFLPDEYRLRWWGKIIRLLNIDELPQMLNILKGEMSWIGPRPLLAQEMLVMTLDEQARRQSMLPGITGWEAVNEGKTSTRSEMAKFDLYYVDNWSLFLDIKIFFETIKIIFLKLRPSDDLRAPKINKSEIKSNTNIKME